MFSAIYRVANVEWKIREIDKAGGNKELDWDNNVFDDLSLIWRDF